MNDSSPVTQSSTTAISQTSTTAKAPAPAHSTSATLLTDSCITMSAATATIESLRATNDALKDINDRLNEQNQSGWKISRAIIVVTSLVAALIVGSNTYREYVALAELRSRSDEMRNQIIDSREHMEESGQKFQTMVADLKKVQLDYSTERDESRTADSLAYRIRCNLEQSLDQMFNRQNPKRALFFADAALTLLHQSRSASPQGPLIQEVVDRYLPIVTLAKLECLWKLGDVAQVSQLAAVAVDEYDCVDACYYDGLARLSLSLTATKDEDTRRSDLARAVDSLTKFVASTQDGDIAELFLAMALFDMGQFVTARDRADRFLSLFPSDADERRKLSTDVRGRISIGVVWRSMADFAVDRRSLPFGDTSSCTIDATAIGVPESQLFERSLERIIRERDEILPNGHDAFVLGAFCTRILSSIRAARFEATGCGPPLDTDSRYLMAEYRVYPPLSNDRSLGIVDNGTLKMRLVTLMPHSISRTRMVGGKPQEDTRIIELPVVERRDLDSLNASIPEARYIDYSWGESFFASPTCAPVEATPVVDGAPAPPDAPAVDAPAVSPDELEPAPATEPAPAAEPAPVDDFPADDNGSTMPSPTPTVSPSQGQTRPKTDSKNSSVILRSRWIDRRGAAANK